MAEATTNQQSWKRYAQQRNEMTEQDRIDADLARNAAKNSDPFNQTAADRATLREAKDRGYPGNRHGY